MSGSICSTDEDTLNFFSSSEITSNDSIFPEKSVHTYTCRAPSTQDKWFQKFLSSQNQKAIHDILMTQNNAKLMIFPSVHKNPTCLEFSQLIDIE